MFSRQVLGESLLGDGKEIAQIPTARVGTRKLVEQPHALEEISSRLASSLRSLERIAQVSSDPRRPRVKYNIESICLSRELYRASKTAIKDRDSKNNGLSPCGPAPR